MNIFSEFLQDIEKVIKAKLARKVAAQTRASFDDPHRIKRMGQINAYEDCLKILKSDYDDFYEDYKTWLE